MDRNLVTFILFFFTFTILRGQRHTNTVRIGTLYDTNDWQTNLAFKYAVHRINMNGELIPKNTLVPIFEKINVFDTYTTAKKVCNFTQKGVGALFGPQTAHNAEIVAAIGEGLDIPTVLTTWDFSNNENKRNCTINLFPETNLLSKAFRDLLHMMKWNSFTVMYDEDSNLIYLKEILKYHDSDHSAIIFRKLQSDLDNRPMLKEIQLSGENHIVLHIAPEKLLDFFRKAREVKMMEEYQSYILTHLDSHTIDLEEFKMGRTNITSMRLVDPSDPDLAHVVHDWREGEKRANRILNDISKEKITTEAALAYDSVFLFAQALHTKGYGRVPYITSPLKCEQATKSQYGYATANYMKLINEKGLTGEMSFDSYGRRINFVLHIVELSRSGYTEVGTWTPSEGIVYSSTYDELQSHKIQDLLENKTFIVASKLGEPFLYVKPNSSLTGNDRYEGFSLDLIDIIAKELNFNYIFQLEPENKYGSYNPVTKKWDGLVKMLLDRKADLAICDLTITYDRERVVDFTMPFMTLGISILYSKPPKQNPSLWKFLEPFSVDVWFYMATAYLGVSLLLFVLARMSPYEWDNPHPCNQDCEELENTFNLVNCLWFVLGSLMCQGCDYLPKISPYEWAKPHPCNTEAEEMETTMNFSNSIWHNCGSLMQQGSDIAPKAISSRLVAGMWWFFTLIMISSYTANLAAFLTLDQMKPQIENADDLAKQSLIKYGALIGGSTLEFFKNSNFSTYQRMWAAMESAQPTVFTLSNNEGVDRVTKGKQKYAFLMESTMIEYQVERHCDLQQIGGLLDTKGYGIAMPMNSPYRTKISGIVLKMQEDGRLHLLKEKWWKDMYNNGSCVESEEKPAGSAAELGVRNVGGVFLVLALGCAAGFFMSVMEFLWNIRKVAVEEGITPKEALIMELKFAIQCGVSTKPVRKKRGSSDGSSKSNGSKEQLQRETADDQVEMVKN